MLKVQKMLVGAMARLDDAMVLNLVKQGLQMGINPYVLLEEVRAGTERVGELYNKGEYFLSDLIMAAEIFKDVLEMVSKVSKGKNRTTPLVSPYSPVIFGTVENDIHDIGKNITIGILRYSGFSVWDLGVDVPAAAFVEAAKRCQSRIICLTGLITESYDSMKKTVQLLDEAGLRGRMTLIIGGLVNEVVRQYTGADYWSTDCRKVLELCRTISTGNEMKAQSL
ncbi:MAG TPA: cobalamin-dependent protein [Methylomusa anaerophila]|uniref:Methionine synthase n=1 Tax=Methylomusa anaerophila TaxID=1930071 RepID=A0A348AJ59_9FIRM|nr:cobalamin-dependent protein [Methylomusa anaerophila]BBB91107.1 methionine synthase [Methylomusa anaerophila]HML88984.1 cobalamin-dependent protein [Methylomusa anaerophila]